MPHLTFISNLRSVNSERPEETKTPHSGVQYINPSPHPDGTCQVCANFIAPNRCKTVKGPIDLTGWCKRFDKIVAR